MATRTLTNGKKIKALWRSLAPLTFVAVHPLSVQWHLGVCLVNAPDPREAEGPTRASAAGRAGV